MQKKEKWITIILFLGMVFGFSIWNFLSPQSTFSYNENRELQTFPSFSTEKLFSGEWQKKFEAYLTDQFPVRDSWVSAYVEAERILQKKDVNGVIFAQDEYMVAMDRPDAVDSSVVEKNLNRLEKFTAYFAEKLGTEHMSVMLVPTTEQAVEDKLPYGAAQMVYDPKGLIARAREHLDESVWVDVEEVLLRHPGEYLYYRTDHHWTMLGAFYAYQQWMAQKGYGEVQLSDYKQTVLSEEFLGTTYSKAPGWGIRPDTMLALDKQDPSSYTLRLDLQDQTITGLYNMEKLTEKDKYAAYVYGNTAVTEITGGEKNGRTLMIFKDSFAHSFATLAAADFEKVYLVDPRYYQQDLWEFAEQNGVTDVLFLFNATNFAQEKNLYILD